MKRTISTRELVARVRATQSSKYRLSVRDTDAWLVDLEAKGLVARFGDGWRLTPKGRHHFRGVELTWGLEAA